MMLYQLPPIILKLCNTSTNIIILICYITHYTLYIISVTDMFLIQFLIKTTLQCGQPGNHGLLPASRKKYFSSTEYLDWL